MANHRELCEEEQSARLAAFRDELRQLLDKHGAVLGVTVEGDTHGIDDEYIDVSFKPRENSHMTRCSDAVRLFEDS